MSLSSWEYTAPAVASYLEVEPISDLQVRWTYGGLHAGPPLALLPGLFDALARDEAGWGDEFGHKDMWFLARDIAFEDPDAEDPTEQMLFCLGVPPTPGAPVPTPEEIRRRQEAARAFA